MYSKLLIMGRIINPHASSLATQKRYTPTFANLQTISQNGGCECSWGNPVPGLKYFEVIGETRCLVRLPLELTETHSIELKCNCGFCHEMQDGLLGIQRMQNSGPQEGQGEYLEPTGWWLRTDSSDCLLWPWVSYFTSLCLSLNRWHCTVCTSVSIIKWINDCAVLSTYCLINKC